MSSMASMAILAAPTTAPAVGIRPKADAAITLRRSPGVEFVARCHRAVNLGSLLLVSHFLSAMLLASGHAWLATRVLLLQSLRVTGLAARIAAMLSSKALYQLWNSRTVKMLRKKVVFEFMVAILGPGGNNLILIVFWPGWFVLAAIIWGVRASLGW